MHEDYLALYRQAFAEFHTLALWDVRAVLEPRREDALVVARRLIGAEDAGARVLGERIERACGVVAG